MKEWFNIGPLGGYDSKAASDFYSYKHEGESLTQQHFKEEQDVNTIVKRFGLTGDRLAEFSPEGAYGDFSGIQDFDDAVAKVAAVNGRFMELPPEFRQKFGNNPGELIRFASKLTPEEFDNLNRHVAPPPPVPPNPPKAEGSS